MRLDKFLKVARILKRRTVSKELALAGRVNVNGRVAKPATEVQVGDELQLELNDRTLTVRIVDIKEQVGKQAAASLYEVCAEILHETF